MILFNNAVDNNKNRVNFKNGLEVTGNKVYSNISLGLFKY